jgi:hypothetical protein
MKVGGAQNEMYTHTTICFTPEVTEYFIHHLSEADWLMRACDICAEVSKSWLPTFMPATIIK